MGLTDVVKAVVSPANKLIDNVSAAIGKVYEPRHIVRTAKAEAKKLN